MRYPFLAALATMIACSSASPAPLVAAEPAATAIKQANALLEQKKSSEGRELLEKAIADWQKVAVAKPGDSDAHYQLAQLYMELSRDDEAEAAIDQAIQRDENRGEYHYLKGVLASYAENYDAAIVSVRRAVELDSKNSRYHDRLARLYMVKRDDAKAEPEFQALVKLDPKNIGGWVRLAIIYRRRNDFEAAIRYIERARAIDPKNVEALQMAGVIYEIGERLEEHRAAIKALLAIVPDNEYALGRLLVDHANAGRRDEAAALRKRLMELHSQGKLKSPTFDREVYFIGKTEVAAREHYELVGPRALRYTFDILPAEGPRYTISLGSYDITTNFARESGEIKADERLFHLDWYGPEGEHRTYGMYEKEPTYERTREMVREIIEKKLQPMSSSKPAK